MFSIENLKKKFKNEWVLIEVINEDENGIPVEIKLIEHSRNRDDIYQALKHTKDKYTFQFYTGNIPNKGYAVAFNDII